MKQKKFTNSIAFTLILILAIALAALMLGRENHVNSDTYLKSSEVYRLSGLKGSVIGNTYRVELRRPDLTTSVNGIPMSPEFGLSAWLTLSGSPQHAILLGDLPLKESEVNEVLRIAIENGLSVPALHNRFIEDSNRIMSLHIEGFGTQEALATAMGRLWSQLTALNNKKKAKKEMTAKPNPNQSALKASLMERLLWKGEMLNGVFHISVGRGTTLAHQEMSEPTGVKSWALFSGSEENAVVTGDIASLENELPYVLKDLIQANIQITSIHSHLVQETPKLVFVHFWGTGKVTELAAGVKAAFWEKEHFQSQ